MQIFVLSLAGKPIFTRHPTSNFISQSASLSALLSFSSSSSVYLKAVDFEDNTSLVAMRKGGIVLGARGKGEKGYMRLVCEYVYSQIVSTLTLKVQSIFRKSSKFDLRSMLTSTDSIIQGLLDKSESTGCLMTGSVETVWLERGARKELSRVMVSAASRVPNTVFGVLVSEGKLCTCVQPKEGVGIRLKGSDLILLSNFAKVQKKTLMNSESWFPLCLPGFNAQGFLYCYCYCLHEAAGMFLMLISNVNTPEMFHSFQSARVAIGDALGVGEGDGEGEGGEVVKGVLKSMEDWERRVTERYSGYAGVLHFLYRGDFKVGGTGGGTVSQCLSPGLGFPFVGGGEEGRGRIWREYQAMAGGIRGGWLKEREGEEEDDGTEFRTPEIDFIAESAEAGRIEYKVMGTEMFVGMAGFGGEIYAVMPSVVGVEEGVRRLARLGRRIWEDKDVLFVVNPPVFGSGG